jgi:osmotically-inducible protein OsmY
MKTDMQLQQDVIAELKLETSVNATDIGVEVKEGHVTLIGTVKSWAERDLALLCVWGAPGIRNIAHNLIVAN